MREVIPERLWIGHAHDGHDPKRILDLGIEAVVDLALEEPPAQFSRELVYCRFPLIDGAGNSTTVLQAVIQTTAVLIRLQVPTLVACGAGLSRSPAIVAAALSFIEGCSLHDALLRVAEGQPHDVSPSLLAEVKAVVEANLSDCRQRPRLRFRY